MRTFPDASLSADVGKDDDVLSLEGVFAILLEHAWLIGLCVLAALALGLGWIRHSTPIYASKASIFLEPPKNIVNIAQVTVEDPRTIDSVNNIIQIVQSHQLLESVGKDLKLGSNPDFLGRAYKADHPVPDSDVAEMLMHAVGANQRAQSNILDVTVEHLDPHIAQMICHAVAMRLIQKNTEDRNQSSEMARSALFPESERIKEDYKKAQLALQDYREQTHVVVADKEEIDTLNRKLNEKREQLVSLESDLKQLPDIGNDPAKLLGLPNIAADPAVSHLQVSLSEQREVVAKMAQRYTEEHPKMIAARGALKAIQGAINQAALDAAKQLQPNYEAAMAQEKNLEAMIMNRSRESITYESLQHELDKSRDLYQKLQDRINETDITEKLNVPMIHLIDDASFSNDPVKPNKRKIMLACLAAGIIGGGLLSFVLHAIDATIKTPEQIESVLKLGVLSTIPQFRTHRGRKGTIVPEITNAVREALRTMAVSIQFMARKTGAHIILFTSAQPAEGKTFCSYHCAVQLATLGHTVLLIDADLRKPSQHEMLEAALQVPGLRDYLSDQVPIETIIVSTKVENLSFIGAGKSVPHPLRLLTGPAMGALLHSLKDKYQFIILDSAPVNSVSDTLLLAPHVHEVALIARGSSTTLRSLRHTISQLQSTGEREPCGVILNRFQQRRGLYYYGNYSYHKSYGEHGAYGDPQQAKKKI